MPEFAHLLEGYRRFRREGYPQQRARFDRLSTEGQSPQLMIIACSDSRVDPSQIFDVDPGEIFVVRNVAALVPPYETTPGHHGVSAAIEFAVQMLQVKQIVVMGHGMCGGCKAALTESFHGASHGEGAFIADWISMLDDARVPVTEQFGTEGREAERAMELAAVRLSLRNLLTFPWLKAKVDAGSLKMQGAFFAISEGVLYHLDSDMDEFVAVE
ncbi:carbonic anhydrase [Erythrobacter sp. SDW2]|uniref:carbonic anhydrase n=1 Tax=Erythrobacter sp. SDW2 TaxID=2907154 RepID=UPI001F1BAAAA|nr:carbonic anhydrase [Erythrobacter sp. SDW2]UIP05743.1 carbonic anhydrase [Erythrobacter sp. SDW2]